MQITVKFFAFLREGRGKIQNIDLDAPTSVGAILEHLQIDPEDIAILLVNGRDSALDYVLQADDVLALFPPSGGG